MKCPRCGNERVHPSRLRDDNELYISMLTGFEPWRCMGCQHRFWRFRLRVKKGEPRRSWHPHISSGLRGFMNDVRTFWPRNKGRVFPLLLRALLVAALAVGTAAAVMYISGQMKSKAEVVQVKPLAK